MATINGTAGDDRLNLTFAPDQIIDGGAGVDTAVINTVGGPTTVDLRTGSVTMQGRAGSTQLVSIERVELTHGGTVIGSAGDDWISLQVNNSAAAMVSGGPGNDYIRSNLTYAPFFHSSTQNVLGGGAGLDTVEYRGPAGSFMVSIQGPITKVYERVSFGVGRSDQLNGVERLKFADGYLAISADDIAAQVYRLYGATLGRTPDGAGLASWVSAIEGGSSLAAAASGFVGSPEFQRAYGPLDDGQFVERLYQNVLGRSSDPTGLADWTNALSMGASRASVVLGFSESDEYKRVVTAPMELGVWVQNPNAAQVARLYDTVFDRKPDAQGLLDWTTALDAGTATLSQVAGGFVRAFEFWSRYGPLNDTAFVNLLYTNVLGRNGEPSGVAGWTDFLAQGHTRAEVVIGFSESAEHIRLLAPNIDAGVLLA